MDMNSTKQFISDNKKVVAAGSLITIGGVTAAVLAPTYIGKAAALMATGLLLGVGFWAGKQITNKLDEFRVMMDKGLVEELKNMMSNVPPSGNEQKAG
jgi:hypothetical protein